MPAPSHADWKRARLRYIRNVKLTLNDLAKDLGLAPPFVRKKAAEEGWVEMRKEYQKQLTEELTRRLHHNIPETAETLLKKSKRRAKQWNEVQAQLAVLLGELKKRATFQGVEDTAAINKIAQLGKIINTLSTSLKEANLGERLEDGQPLTIAKSDVNITENTEELDKIKKTLGLSDDDFSDENIEETLKKIDDYYMTDYGEHTDESAESPEDVGDEEVSE